MSFDATMTVNGAGTSVPPVTSPSFRLAIASTRSFAAHNRWSLRPVVELGLNDLPTEPVPGPAVERIVEGLSRLRLPPQFGCPASALRSTADECEDWLSVAACLASELQRLAGDYDGRWHRSRQSVTPAGCAIALECRFEDVARTALGAAVETVNAAIHGEILSLESHCRTIQDVDEQCCDGATAPMVEAAERRGIPIYRCGMEGLVQLGEGVRQRRVYRAMTGETSLVAERLSTDKEATKRLWHRLGIPVAAGRVAPSLDEALQAAKVLGWPVVAKPRSADYGNGVTTDIRDEETLRQAYRDARAEGDDVLIERHLHGALHRLLVVGGRLVSAVRREPPALRGDGRRTVRRLIELANRDARRGPDFRWPVRTLRVGPRELSTLAAAGMSLETILPVGATLPLRNDPMTTGGSRTIDVTDEVHPETRALACDAARIIGLDIAGLDLIATNIARPLADQGAGFLEINAEPALYLHLRPVCDTTRDVPAAIIDLMFPSKPEANAATGRISLCLAIGGSPMEAAIAMAAISATDAGAGESPGTVVSTPSATTLDGRPLAPADDSVAERISTVMRHPRASEAYVTFPWDEAVTRGVGVDRCRLLVLGESDEARRRRTGDAGFAFVRRLLAGSEESVICLNDPLWRRFAVAGSERQFLIAADPTDPLLREHIALGGSGAAPVDGDAILVQTGGAERRYGLESLRSLSEGTNRPIDLPALCLGVAIRQFMGLS